MIVEVKYDKINKCIYFKCSGATKVDDLLNEVDKVHEQEGFENNTNVIWDLKNCELYIHSQSINIIDQLVNDRKSHFGDNYKVAIIINKSQHSAIAAHVALTKMEELPYEVKFYYDLDEATSWIKFRPELL